MFELKPLPGDRAEEAIELARRCRAAGEPEESESMCLDVLARHPDHGEALRLLVLSRSDLLDRGLPGGVERAREPLARIADDFERAYLDGVVCERQARYLLQARGARSSFVAWEWFRRAIARFEEAARSAPDRIEPLLRHNSCVRMIDRNRHCIPAPQDLGELGIE